MDTVIHDVESGLTQFGQECRQRPESTAWNAAVDKALAFHVIAGTRFGRTRRAAHGTGDEDAAWLLNPSENDDLAGALRAGSSVVIEGTSDKGIKISETFSLSGATAASRALEGECTG